MLLSMAFVSLMILLVYVFSFIFFALRPWSGRTLSRQATILIMNITLLNLMHLKLLGL
jgi:hypothetical protein